MMVSSLKLAFLFFILSIGIANGQQIEKYQLGLFHKSNGNIQYIKNGKRVIVRTTDGQRLRGQMTILDGGRVFVNGQEAAISEIARITRNPIGQKAVGAGIIVLGLTVVQLDFFLSAALNSNPLITDNVSPGGTGFIIAAAGLPFFIFKSPFSERNWIFQVVPE